MTPIAYVFSKLRTVKDVVRQMPKKPRFRTPFDIQHAECSQKLVKSAWQHLYYIFQSALEKVS